MPAFSAARSPHRFAMWAVWRGFTSVARLRRMSRPEAVYFFADAHLGTDPKEKEAAREARLHDFLTSIVDRAAALYIVGDLFDFWFEYRTAIPRRQFGTLAAMRRLREAGVEITYIHGHLHIRL